MLFIDADMLLSATSTRWRSARGAAIVVGARERAIGTSNAMAANFLPPDRVALAKPVGWYHMLHRDDLKRIAPLWLEFCGASAHQPAAVLVDERLDPARHPHRRRVRPPRRGAVDLGDVRLRLRRGDGGRRPRDHQRRRRVPELGAADAGAATSSTTASTSTSASSLQLEQDGVQEPRPLQVQGPLLRAAAEAAQQGRALRRLRRQHAQRRLLRLLPHAVRRRRAGGRGRRLPAARGAAAVEGALRRPQLLRRPPRQLLGVGAGRRVREQPGVHAHHLPQGVRRVQGRAGGGGRRAAAPPPTTRCRAPPSPPPLRRQALHATRTARRSTAAAAAAEDGNLGGGGGGGGENAGRRGGGRVGECVVGSAAADGHRRRRSPTALAGDRRRAHVAARGARDRAEARGPRAYGDASKPAVGVAPVVSGIGGAGAAPGAPRGRGGRQRRRRSVAAQRGGGAAPPAPPRVWRRTWRAAATRDETRAGRWRTSRSTAGWATTWWPAC